MDNNGNMPAMPCEVVEQYHIDASQAPKGAPTLRERKVMSGGMTKREMVAMHIMSGYVANSKAGEAGELMCMHDVASYSVGCADALLAELERTK